MRFFSVESVRLMCGLMREWGQDPQVALRAAGIRAAWLDDPTRRLPSSAELAFIREYRVRLGRVPGLAVMTGQRYHLAVFGPLGMAMLSAKTLGDSVRVAIRYQDLSFSWVRFVVNTRGPDVAVTLDAGDVPGDLRDFLVCRDVAAIGTMLGDLTQHSLAYTRVALNLADPTQADGLEVHLGCPVSLRADESEMSFAARHLLRPNRHHSLTTQAMSVAACEAQLGSSARTTGTVSSQIESLMLQRSGSSLSLEAAALQLGCSGRHLRRLLEDEGTSFKDIRQRVLSTRAGHLLRTTHLPIADIAEQLGFADASSFSQSYRRWTGEPPSRHRGPPQSASPEVSSVTGTQEQKRLRSP